MERATLTQTSAEMQRDFASRSLESLFRDCFLADFNTVLVGGADEPFYQPASEGQPARLYYTRDYFRSALHEVAHWCVAGEARRQLPDFGYWYAADGRDALSQVEFQRVEVVPQALELLFCAAAGHGFRMSLDNLNGDTPDPSPFESAVLAQARARLHQGLEGRVARWCETLAGYYRGSNGFQQHWIDEVYRCW